jgi:predicted nucleic acid-binding protein
LRGWLLDTNVVAALINPQGAPSVKAWAAGQDEETFHISVLTLAEYDKGIHNLPDGLIRTVQRRMKIWRSAQANALVFGPFADAAQQTDVVEAVQ